ncbi:MAG TPA: hypothetical protein VMV72_09585 [Verrucomicrobiae bacterium]|nr:hypothetical protein [Verrucomicrobiae bacterium]
MTTRIQEVSHGMESPAEIHKPAEVMASGSMVETIAGISALVLTIIALAGMASETLTAVAALALGSAFLLEGVGMGARYTHVIHEAEGGWWSTAAEMGSGIMVAFVAGGAGIVLGVLTLLGLAETVLLPIMAIVFGSALVLSCGAVSKLNYLQMVDERTEQRYRILAREAVSAASGLQVLVGLGAIVLGILALLHIQWMILTMISLLAVSAAVAFSGAALSSRFWGFWLR